MHQPALGELAVREELGDHLLVKLLVAARDVDRDGDWHRGSLLGSIMLRALLRWLHPCDCHAGRAALVSDSGQAWWPVVTCRVGRWRAGGRG
jgi:hypothetical protein